MTNVQLKSWLSAWVRCTTFLLIERYAYNWSVFPFTLVTHIPSTSTREARGHRSLWWNSCWALTGAACLHLGHCHDDGGVDVVQWFLKRLLKNNELSSTIKPEWHERFLKNILLILNFNMFFNIERHWDLTH